MLNSPPELVSQGPALPRRAPDANKGRFGRVLVVAGSRGMSGAAVLCGGAALRGGAGLVRVATAASTQPLVAVGNPCFTTVPLPEDELGRISTAAESALLHEMESCDVVALGPGLGQSAGLRLLLPRVLARSDKPIVLDADGLNALVGQSDSLRRAAPL